MSYQVLARKWRPGNFREMVGQEHVLQALINALDNDRLHHAFLFTGTRGVGKTTIARILAKCLNCEEGVRSEPCGHCSSCTEIAEGRFIDLIEVDAASRTKVEDTRELLENVQYAPSRGRYKVYLIDEVHMLSASSFNALLKTLEEPPPHVKFLLATTDPQKLPVTILSRCLQFNLKNLNSERIVAHLQHILEQEKIPAEVPALWQLARAADGSMRDALSLTDQAIGYGNGCIQETDVRRMLGTIEKQYVTDLVRNLQAQDANALFQTIDKMAEQNPDYSNALDELLSLLHRIAVQQAVPDYRDQRFGDHESVTELASAITAEDIQLFYQLGIYGQKELSLAPDPRSGFEMALLRMLAFKPQGIPQLPTEQTEKTSTDKITEETVRSKKQSPAPAPVQHNQNTDDITAIGLKNLSSENWHLHFQQLQLNGILHNIGNHCILDHIQHSENQTHIHFTLDENQAALFNSNHTKRLSDAFSQYHRQMVTIDISVGVPARETPAAIEKRQQAERLATAQQLFNEDPFVQEVIEQFDGKILTHTIRPLTH
jgi:DNA polymerase-3 subunit gamma/tau